MGSLASKGRMNEGKGHNEQQWHDHRPDDIGLTGYELRAVQSPRSAAAAPPNPEAIHAKGKVQTRPG